MSRLRPFTRLGSGVPLDVIRLLDSKIVVLEVLFVQHGVGIIGNRVFLLLFSLLGAHGGLLFRRGRPVAFLTARGRPRVSMRIAATTSGLIRRGRVASLVLHNLLVLLLLSEIVPPHRRMHATQ